MEYDDTLFYVKFHIYIGKFITELIALPVEIM